MKVRFFENVGKKNEFMVGELDLDLIPKRNEIVWLDSDEYQVVRVHHNLSLIDNYHTVDIDMVPVYYEDEE